MPLRPLSLRVLLRIPGVASWSRRSSPCIAARAHESPCSTASACASFGRCGSGRLRSSVSHSGGGGSFPAHRRLRVDLGRMDRAGAGTVPSRAPAVREPDGHHGQLRGQGQQHGHGPRSRRQGRRAARRCARSGSRNAADACPAGFAQAAFTGDRQSRVRPRCRSARCRTP